MHPFGLYSCFEVALLCSQSNFRFVSALEYFFLNLFKVEMNIPRMYINCKYSDELLGYTNMNINLL